MIRKGVLAKATVRDRPGHSESPLNQQNRGPRSSPSATPLTSAISPAVPWCQHSSRFPRTPPVWQQPFAQSGAQSWAQCQRLDLLVPAVGTPGTKHWAPRTLACAPPLPSPSLPGLHGQGQAWVPPGKGSPSQAVKEGSAVLRSWMSWISRLSERPDLVFGLAPAGDPPNLGT